MAAPPGIKLSVGQYEILALIRAITTTLLLQAKGIKNIEDLMREKGEEVRRVSGTQDLEFVPEEDGTSVEKLP